MTSVFIGLVSAGTTIIVLILGELLFGSKILSLIERHRTIIISAHDNQAADHNRILEDTNALRVDNRIILKISENLNGKIEAIDKDLLNEKENKRLQFESLSDKQREIKNSLDRLVSFSDEFEKKSMENSKLWREKEELKEENRELGRIIKLQKARISELERINEIQTEEVKDKIVHTMPEIN
ncbi:hypothetical protein [Ruminiclostridium cellobioparum]|jgi:hypothetical protein|uniref:hypothetical protein n=1 Tax=Ruminiclostridium cellobioparum TaxID=29355 RepID=UPI0004873CEE|nr:hypothetical protein [Ruminiclostridium cellobioparum]